MKLELAELRKKTIEELFSNMDLIRTSLVNGEIQVRQNIKLVEVSIHGPNDSNYTLRIEDSYSFGILTSVEDCSWSINPHTRTIGCSIDNCQYHWTVSCATPSWGALFDIFDKAPFYLP